ncbi:conserved hypothetical protein [Neospora caninum Liverpool]|uniref:ubiquitinyl hydrolase 1 n=1 Tax=Neospora caninum (strain Liverpool) TaxID=572307 RepID=F0VQ88_NEOCL|nr:conserved hypothetical protein [Neospora caninum Liverpool]CBZ55885.1 conserved hypothetical protein [Neospora caninum Liverpool]CEL70628.1 TPA: hypothetical protein BN1204_063110 [Neospora caninum Liverpool]|eukprot:XP_003885911.1 conserved hypothetical protein [Neospora caninum Liverpool]
MEDRVGGETGSSGAAHVPPEEIGEKDVDAGDASAARERQMELEAGAKSEEKERQSEDAGDRLHESVVRSEGDRNGRDEPEDGTTETEGKGETGANEGEDGATEEEQTVPRFRLRVRCAPFNPVVEIASNKTFQDLLKAVAQVTELPYLEDAEKFSLLAGFPPKRLEAARDARLSSFLQDGEVLTPERRRSSQDAAIVCSTTSPLSRREGRGAAQRTPSRRTVSQDANIHTLSSSGRREPALSSPGADSHRRSGREGGRKGRAPALGSSEEEVAENLVRLFHVISHFGFFLFTLFLPLLIVALFPPLNLLPRLLARIRCSRHVKNAGETTADERWGAVQGGRFEIKEGHPQPGKFTVSFFAPVAGRVDTQRTEEYTALPKTLVLLVLSQVWKSAEDVDRHNLRPYYMAHAQPMMFWNIVRHFQGDFGACFRQGLPAAAVDELLERKRELSVKAKENKRQAEEAALVREEKRLMRAQQKLARAARPKATAQREDVPGVTPQSETVSSLAAEESAWGGEGKETGAQERGQEAQEEGTGDERGARAETSGRNAGSEERRDELRVAIIPVADGSEGEAERGAGKPPGGPLPPEGRPGDRDGGEKDGNDAKKNPQKNGEKTEGRGGPASEESVQRGDENSAIEQAEGDGARKQRASAGEQRKRRRAVEAEGDGANEAAQESEERHRRPRIDEQENAVCCGVTTASSAPCLAEEASNEGGVESAVAQNAALTAASSRLEGEPSSDCPRPALSSAASPSRTSFGREKGDSEEISTMQRPGDVSAKPEEERSTGDAATGRRRRRGANGDGTKSEAVPPLPEILVSWVGKEEEEDEDYEAVSEEEEDTERRRSTRRVNANAGNRRRRGNVTGKGKKGETEGACSHESRADRSSPTQADSRAPSSSLSSLPSVSREVDTKKRARHSRGRRRGGAAVPREEKLREEQQQTVEERRRNLAAAAEARAARQALSPSSG